MTTAVNTRDAILQASVDRIVNDEIDNAVSLLRSETNKVFAQRAEPYTNSTYTLRESDLWIDQGSVNWATYTSEMSSGTNEYNLTNMSTTLLNQIAGPLPYITGTSLVADRFIEDTSTSGKFIGKSIKWATIGTGTHTVSIYLKANTSYTVRYAELIITSTVAGVNKYASYDLTTGFCKTSDDSTITAKCIYVGDGWYRCSITVTIISAINTALQIKLSDINTSFAHAYTGNGNSGMYAWGLMVEANVSGDVSPGKYIENSGNSVPGTLDTRTNNVIYTWDTLYWASAQLKELNDITDDNILTPAEKSYIIREYDTIINEQTQLNNQATTLGGLTSSTSTYNTALSTLTSYLATLTTPYMWNDVSAGHITNINGSTFRSNFTTFYTARDAYVKDIGIRSSQLAVWDNVSGNNKPADNASNGTILNTDPFCTKISKWLGNGTSQYVEITGLTDGQLGTTSFRNTTTATNKYISSNLVPVDPNKIYRVRGWFRKSSGADGVLYLIAGLADSAGNIIAGSGTHWRYPASAVTLTTSWAEYSGTFGYGQSSTIPSNAKYVYIGTYMHYNGTTGYHECQGLRLEDISIAAWPNVVGTNRPEDNANNIGVSSETPPSGAISLISSLDTSAGTYLLRPVKSVNSGLDLLIGSDNKTLEIESHSSERDHILLSSDFSMSSASLSEVPGMQFSVLANTKYFISGTLLITTGVTAATFSADMTVPSGATVYMSPSTGGPLVSGVVIPYNVNAILSIGGTAGLVKLRFASGNTTTVTMKQNSLLVLNEVVNVTPPASGGYVIDTSPALGSGYTSSQTTTSGGCTASAILTVKTNGTVVVSVGTGDTLSGTPTSDNWSTGAGNDPENFEVLFTVGTLTGSPTISNGAASYTKLDSDRTITVTKTCPYNSSAIATAQITITVRKRGTTTPTYTDITTLTVDVSSENPYI